MQIELTQKFKKQVSNSTDQRIKLKILSIIESAAKSENITEFPNLKKLTGFKNKYRIRLGNYRIGIVIENKTVIFAAFDHRSDIYKYFP